MDGWETGEEIGSRDLAQQSLNAVGPEFSLTSRVLVEAKRDPGVRKARARMVGPEVKGRVAQVFDEKAYPFASGHTRC